MSDELTNFKLCQTENANWCYSVWGPGNEGFIYYNLSRIHRKANDANLAVKLLENKKNEQGTTFKYRNR